MRFLIFEREMLFTYLSRDFQVALDLTEDEKHQLQKLVAEEGG
jgi:hypothetical protein